MYRSLIVCTTQVGYIRTISEIFFILPLFKDFKMLKVEIGECDYIPIC